MIEGTDPGQELLADMVMRLQTRLGALEEVVRRIQEGTVYQLEDLENRIERLERGPG